jgi:hypothetical protein
MTSLLLAFFVTIPKKGTQKQLLKFSRLAGFAAQPLAEKNSYPET